MTGMSNGWTLGESSKLPPGAELIEFAILEYTMADIIPPIGINRAFRMYTSYRHKAAFAEYLEFQSE
jgi:hypothetical protein